MQDEYFVLPKAMFFVFNLMNYCLHSVQNQLLENSWHLTLKELAFANMLQFFSFLGSLFWTYFADRTGYFKSVIALNTIMFGLTWASPFIPARYIVTQHERVWMVSFVVSLAGFFQSALFPILDAVAIGYISRTGKFSKELFGRQRFWGAFGHWVSTLVSVFMRDRFGYGSLIVLLMGSCLTLFLIIVIGVPNDLTLEVGHGHHGPAKKDEKKPEESATATLTAAPIAPKKKRGPLLALLTNPSFLFFLLFMLLAGVTRSVMTNYQNYFVDKFFDRKGYLMVLGTVRFFSEGIVYFFNQDLNKTIGVYWMLILSQVAGAARSIGYGLCSLADPKVGYYYLACIPLELCKGLNSGLVTAGAVRIASDLAPVGGANTAQGLFTGVFIGLSMFLGGALSFALFDGSSGNKRDFALDLGKAFGLTGILLLACTAIFVLKYALYDKVIFVRKSPSAASK